MFILYMKERNGHYAAMWGDCNPDMWAMTGESFWLVPGTYDEDGDVLPEFKSGVY